MANKVGWLIEDSDKSQSPRWLRLIRSGHRPATITWTVDASIALRFARKEDAENFWLFCPQDGIIPVITEHAWNDLRTSDGEVEPCPK